MEKERAQQRDKGIARPLRGCGKVWLTMLGEDGRPLCTIPPRVVPANAGAPRARPLVQPLGVMSFLICSVRGYWVPAFAGTTWMSETSDCRTPPRLGSARR